MANDKVEGREMTWRSLFPWTELFRGFQIALDLNKLFLAAGGIVVMAFGWWLLSLIFGAGYSNKPDWPGTYATEYKGDTGKAWQAFRHDRAQWNVMHETAGVGTPDDRYEPQDLAESAAELDLVMTALSKKAKEATIVQLRKEAEAKNKESEASTKDADKISAKIEADKKLLQAQELQQELNANDQDFKNYAIDKLVRENKLSPKRAELFKTRLETLKPYAKLATWPWWEDRGPNPFLLATGQTGIPWEPGHFWDWFLRHQLLVVLEPVVKLVLPLVYFFKPSVDGWPSLYFFLVFVWTVLTWSFFGGAITRIAAVQVARGEKIGLMDAVNFTVKRIVSYLTAPLFPIGFLLVLIVLSIIFGIIQLIPLLGDFVSGLLWVIPLVFGLLMAVTLVGLVVGWPLMSPTISAEGTDSWEAVSRSFSYVFQKPFHYLWYALVAACYGAILIFFIGFMGSFTVYMSKWAVSQTPFSEATHRDPTYLMVYAPESFGWRTLLLQGAKVDGDPLVQGGEINPELLKKYKSDNPEVHKEWQWHWWNTCGAFLMAIWLGLVFLLVIGFGYSFFWSEVTIIYMLMRKSADGAELDEVYLDEDETDGVFGSSLPTSPSTAVKTPASAPLQMVEPPALRPTTVTTPAPALMTTPAPAPMPAPPPETKTEAPTSLEAPPPSSNGGVEKSSPE